MADVWKGNIVFPDNSEIKEVILTSRNVASSPTLFPPALRFLSTVDTSRIPLYLAAGPSLDVYTSCEETEQWFQSVLLSKVASNSDVSQDAVAHEWWTCPRAQSPIGVLVECTQESPNERPPRITEILFYGTIATTAPTNLLTPPSSSPNPLRSQSDQTFELPELRVHALPLSSDLLDQSNLPNSPPLSPAFQAENEPQFLPALQGASSTTSPKRKRDIFDEATQLRRKARRKGGEGVAAAAARVSESRQASARRKSSSTDVKATAVPESRPSSACGALIRPPSRRLSRSPSVSSDSRPQSRKGVHDGHAKRSTLSQVATVRHEPEEPTIESRNKEALSRVVMAAMRMHGLQQRRRNKGPAGTAARVGDQDAQVREEAAAEESARDEEYKLIYHQTYKGAALALRKHMPTKTLHLQPDRLRDVVEKLLALFCTDPLDDPLPAEFSNDALATPGDQHRAGIFESAHSCATPFDLPSGSKVVGARRDKQTAPHTGSPVLRRKDMNKGRP